MADDKTNESGGFAVLEGMGGLGVIKQIGLMIGLAISISLGLWVVLMSQEPDFRPLYTDISHLEAGQVADILQRENIRFKVDTTSGMLLVESDKIHQARMKLAAEGFPAGNTLGYELLDKEQGFGTSQFMEKTRYYRSIEGELARTISSMNRVRGARVHLAIPKRSVFVNDRRKPSASVFVELYPNQSLERMQVASIVHLVASSIPELEDKHVTVVDQRGQLLSETDADADIAVAAKQLDYAKSLEQKYIERIEGILDPIVGNDGFKVQVSADIDFSQTEQTSEFFSPDLPAVRSEQTLSEVVGAGGASAGIPGA
ncbi:MAG TPA: flagellar M-ring protein FliF, partial [Gammaproteobacteria bacterium]|nr:flagellar M-ring protein FliF [Gammaproteobacteria bacterium]